MDIARLMADFRRKLTEDFERIIGDASERFRALSTALPEQEYGRR
jgi:hypothetical protein